MRKSVRWSMLCACFAGALVIGCGGDKKNTDDNNEGTGTFLPGQWHIKVTTSGVGGNAICALVPVTVETADTVACSIPDLLANHLIGIDDMTCTTIDSNDVQVNCSGTLADGEGCDITFDFTGGGKLYSDRGTVTLTAAISDLPATPACEQYENFPCQLKIVIESTRTGDAPAGACAPAASRGPASLLGVSWDELKPRVR